MSFKAIPTKSTVETVARALQLVQKTNSWTQGQDLGQIEDSQGKTRSSFCLRGALRAAVTGDTEGARNSYGRTTRQEALVRSSSNAIVQTVNANLKKYGLSEKLDRGDVMGFNDAEDVKHRHVVRALRDTVDRLTSTELTSSICGS